MPPKRKKAGLSDAQIQQTVDVVKQYWPTYPISIADIRNPTRNFVLKFYKDCVNDLDEKRKFTARTTSLSYPPGLEEEEVLFLELSNIETLMEADFKLGDLYEFDPKRVNTHIIVTIHFISFSETLMDKMVQTCNSVFDIKDKILENEEELKQLREEKTQSQINLTIAKTESRKLRDTQASMKAKYEEALEKIEESEKKCKELILKIERLKSEIDLQFEEVQKLEDRKDQLKKQIVTEEEYNTLKSNLELLVKEEQNLEEIDLSNGLLEQKQHLTQLDRCLQELKHLELAEDLFKLNNLRDLLKKETQNLEYASANQQKGEAELTHMLNELEKQKYIFQVENQKLEEELKTVMETSILEGENLKNIYQKVFENRLCQIEDITNVIKQQEADHQRLKSDFLNKYNSMCEVYEVALARFQKFMEKVKDKLPRSP